MAGSGGLRSRRRPISIGLVAAIFAVFGVVGPSPAGAAADSTPIAFADHDLLVAINYSRGEFDPDAPVTTAEAATITELYVDGANIDSLDGLQFFTSLQSLGANGNRIADLSPLRTLTRLQTLSVGSNRIADLSPLSTLTRLQTLSVGSNRIADLSPLRTLTELENLTVDSNKVVSLSPLSTLTHLTDIYAESNAIVDVRPLKKLTHLGSADVTDQHVTLPDLATGATQANPLYAVTGSHVIPSSSTARIAANGATWRLLTARTHTLEWNDFGDDGDAVYFGGTITQKATGPNQFATVPTPKISGTTRVGSTLTAVPGSWPAGVTLTYQWYDDGKAISGATSKSLVLSSGRQGGTITVRVTGSKAGYAAASKTSAGTAKVMLAPVPVISGKSTLGSTLTVTVGTWTSGATKKIQWYADKVAVSGATGSSFTVTTSQSGKVIYVRVTGSKSGYGTINMYTADAPKVVLLDTSSRASVTAAYKKILAPALKVPTGWTGSTTSCTVGSESSASKLATMNAVNFFRAMDQLDGVWFSSSWNANALPNSLMMQARSIMTHYPTKDEGNGKCWSTAAQYAAAHSNIALGWGYPNSINPVTGARAIASYMEDPGTNNFIAGHRRWILNPLTTVMGTGSTMLANTLRVMSTYGPVTSQYNAQPTWLEWPSAGYFPKQLEPDGLWSLSASSSSVDFSAATVTVVSVSTGKKVTLVKWPVTNGYGPNTITWQVSGLKVPAGSSTSSYQVTVSGIKGAPVKSYSYTVRMFDVEG